MRVVVLVPWRTTGPELTRAWAIARPYYEALGWPIYEGDKPGEFARAAAINAASADAEPWDVAVIADADTVQEEAPLRRAVSMTHDTSVVPWRTRLKLSLEGTEKLAAGGPGAVSLADLDREDGFAHPSKLLRYPPSRTGSTVVVSRAAWERAGGFDERFKGWGYEDQAFRVQLGPLVAIPGTIWHLWHPHQPRDHRTRANAKLFAKVGRT